MPCITLCVALSTGCGAPPPPTLGVDDGDWVGRHEGGVEGERVMTAHTWATCDVHPAVHTHPERQSHLHCEFASA